jgi:NAD(P)H-dependent flavin oxidoreductase YrpB (nitropropane dioxygenase family)
MPLHGMLIAEAQGRIMRAAASNPGAHDLINYFVGQAVGQMNVVKPAGQVVLDMVEEFITATERMSALLQA